eukprot:1159290-Pelagomonas_calceolata.AAC.7
MENTLQIPRGSASTLYQRCHRDFNGTAHAYGWPIPYLHAGKYATYMAYVYGVGQPYLYPIS